MDDWFKKLNDGCVSQEKMEKLWNELDDLLWYYDDIIFYNRWIRRN